MLLVKCFSDNSSDECDHNSLSKRSFIDICFSSYPTSVCQYSYMYAYHRMTRTFHLQTMICNSVSCSGIVQLLLITVLNWRRAIKKSSCFHNKGHEADCSVSDTFYMVGFGVVQIFLSQLPNFHELWWLSILAAVMSLTYSFIAIGLALAKLISGAVIIHYFKF